MKENHPHLASEGRRSHLVLILSMMTVLLICASLPGALSFRSSAPSPVTNLYGERVMLYGGGVYQHDSLFKAPIFIGTDWGVLLLLAPLLIFFTIKFAREGKTGYLLPLTGLSAVTLYYATSLSFGVAYNLLHLVYIALFSVGFFSLAALLRSLTKLTFITRPDVKLPFKAIYSFLILSAIGLIAAWLPDILSGLLARKPLELIETYTTEITYVLDMGLIAPLNFVCVRLLKRQEPLGWPLLVILLTSSSIIGVMLPLQTFFQIRNGIELPPAALVTKVGIFVILAAVALWLLVRVLSSLELSDKGPASL